MNERARLITGLDKLERERNALVHSLSDVTDEQLSRSPAAGKWSVAQVILHLAIAEESALAYLKKKHGHGKHVPVGVSSHFRLLLLRIALDLPIRYKAPKIVSDVPVISYAEALSRWEKIRMELRKEFTMIPETHIGHDLFKHPAAGKFNLIQAVSFIGTHVRHHREQMHRTVRSVQ